MKKLLINLGAVATASAPLVSVISCGTDYVMTDDQNALLEKLKSTEAVNRLERVWLEKLVVDNLIDNEPSVTDASDIVTDGAIDVSKFVKIDTVKNIFNFFTQGLLVADSRYWIDLIPTFQADPFFSDEGNVEAGELYGSQANIGAFGFNEEFLTRVWYDEIIADVATDPITVSLTTKSESGVDTPNDAQIILDTPEEALEFIMIKLLSNDQLGIINTIFRTMLSQEFLEISREEWDGVFGDDYRDINNLDDGSWKNIHEEVQADAFFPLVKYSLDNLIFMEWNITMDDTDDVNAYRTVSSTSFNGLNSHMDHTDLSGVTHDDGQTNIDNLSNSFQKFNYGANYNQFAVPMTDPNFASTYQNFMGYSGLSSRGQISYYSNTDSEGNKKLDFAINKLKEVESPEFYVGYAHEGSIVSGDEVNKDTDYMFDLLPKDENTVSVQFLYGLMPMYDETNGVFTFEEFDVYDEDGNKTGVNGSFWSGNSDLITLYIYSSDQTGIWNEVKDYIMHEEGDNHKLTIHDPYMYDVYIDLGIDFIKEPGDE